ncbi:kinase-like domain-containing protein [Pavlovales sp. CCMP2436]|nr:kinase-like domain-containing protein [Pavlovales sp. CCMP2436]
MWSLGVLLYIMLSGFPPFFGEDESQLLSRVAAGEYSFPSTVGGTGSHSAVEQATNPFPTSWARVSPLAKDLIKSLLLVQPSQRLTVSQALAHRWISGKYDARHAVQLSLGQLRTRQDNSWDGLKSTRRGPTSMPPKSSSSQPPVEQPKPAKAAPSPAGLPTEEIMARLKSLILRCARA